MQSKTFKQVFEEWTKFVTTMGHTKRGGSWDATINRVATYALPFFGPKKIDTIGPVEFGDYWAHRKTTFNRKPPTNGTLRRERTSILPVFKFAVSRGYITVMPGTEPPKSSNERRPTFTQDEWKTIYTRARDWVIDGESKGAWRQRFMAQQYVLVLANTGLRIGELRGLRWSDLRTVETSDRTRLVGEVRGKTGAREVVFQSGADVYIKRIYDLRLEELAKAPDHSEVIFCHPDGRPIQSMKNSFISLLNFSGISLERNGMSRTLYSLRHFYATMRLSNETSPFLLAKQMGTSVEMLEKFYGQTVSSELAAQITKASRSKKVDKKPKSYPFE